MKPIWNHHWFGVWTTDKIVLENNLYLDDWKDCSWNPEDKELIINYLKTAPIHMSFSHRGDYICKVCGENMGDFSQRQSDGVWLWHFSLYHYVSCHNICLPDAFLDHIRSVNYKLPPVDSIDWLSLDWPK